MPSINLNSRAQNQLFAAQLDLRYPIAQDPMNGILPIELVKQVCNAGSPGSLASASLLPSVIIEAVKTIRQLTMWPFNVSLFILENSQSAEAEIAPTEKLLRPCRNYLRTKIVVKLQPPLTAVRIIIWNSIIRPTGTSVLLDRVEDIIDDQRYRSAWIDLVASA